MNIITIIPWANSSGGGWRRSLLSTGRFKAIEKIFATEKN